MNQDADFDFEVEKINEDDDPFSRQKLLKDWDQDKVKNAKVLVVGAGALGNEVLKNLALLGIGQIFIVDFDEISKSNLSRTLLYRLEDNGKDKSMIAAQRVQEICVEPSAIVRYLSVDIVNDLGDGVFRYFDIVIGCIDNIEARLAISRGSWLAGIPWVDGSISGYHGNVVVFKPFETFCFICTMSHEDKKNIKERYSCELKRFKVWAENKIPTIQTLSSIIAGIQVQEALRLIHGDNSMVGRRISFNGALNSMETTTSNALHDHPNHHGTYVDALVEKLPWLSVNTQLSAFIKGAGLSLDTLEIMLPTRPWHSFILSASCNECSHLFKVGIPLFRLSGDQYNKCPNCGAMQIGDKYKLPDINGSTITLNPTIVLAKNNTDPNLLGMKLIDIGFAPLDIIEVVQNGEFRHFELSADYKTIFEDKRR